MAGQQSIPGEYLWERFVDALIDNEYIEADEAMLEALRLNLEDMYQSMDAEYKRFLKGESEYNKHEDCAYDQVQR